MSLTLSSPPAHTEPPLADRILGRYETGRAGPLFVVSGALHGNEPGGLDAIRRVLAKLAEAELPLRGKLVGFAGNLAALSCRQRYVDRDLNRDWNDDDIHRLLDADPGVYTVEDHQQRALVDLFDGFEQESTGPMVHLDLHSTSGDSAPFVCMADTLRNRRIALAMPVPVLFGLEEAIDGTLNSFLTERGHTALALEGGQHDHPDTTLNHESALWMALVAAGNLDQADVPAYSVHRDRLADAAAAIPRYLEIQHRHSIDPEDQFKMRPGFASFCPVYRGELLAEDRAGPLASPFSGLMLMPLYQSQGDDGYFLARPMSRVRLYLSTVVRTLRLDWTLYLVRGLRRHPDHDDRWIISPKANHAAMTKLLAVFGFRRRLDDSGLVVAARRRPGFMGRRLNPRPLN